MNYSQKIMDILNKDEKALKLLKEHNRVAKEQNLTDEEYRETREFIMMLCIKNNDEAFKLMAREVYHGLRVE